MPFIKVGDLRLHYLTAGDPESPPLLIISGLTDTTAKCDWQLPALAEDFYVITYDNRSAGLSDHPDETYTLADMADDAAHLLSALGIDSANVFGFSMGGMIALHLVLRHPERVKRLILGCTSGGGRLAIPPDAPVIESLVNPVSSGDRYDDFINGMWVSISDSFCESNPDTVEQLAQLAANNPQTPEGYTSQMQAILNHDMADRLGEIRVPVMVLHGDSDRLMPPENGRLLAANISGARLILYPGAGHMFFIEQSARVNRDIRDFFAER